MIPEFRTRATPRLPVSLSVTYSNEGEMVRDVVSNLGGGGLFIRTTRPLPIGTPIEMAIQLGDETLKQKGRITWARGLPIDGMGVRFDDPIDPRLTALVAAKKTENP